MEIFFNLEGCWSFTHFITTQFLIFYQQLKKLSNNVKVLGNILQNQLKNILLNIKNRGGLKMIYDYLIVGSGLYGATCAYELKKEG